MKISRIALLAGSLSVVGLGACDNFLDVNTNPNNPTSVAANLYLPPMLHWMVTSEQYDGRYVGRYTQEWFYAWDGAEDSFQRMGYYKLSDAAAQQWRDVYWSFGQNLIDMMDKARAEERWDLLGVGYVLKAWGWQTLVDLHGPIIIKEAFDQTRFSFDYDSEEYAYQTVQALLDSAIVNLQRTDGAVDASYMARGDHMYNGDRTKWLKFAYGLLAINLSHYTNKASYDPAAVIAAVDNSFTSNADDALLPYPATTNDDTNFWGRSRGNIWPYRQSEFVVKLMDGTDFGVEDPRIGRMLSASPDGDFRGLPVDEANYWVMSADQRPNNLHGYVGSGGVGQPGKYIFADKAKVPAITYSELQFIKAEAAYYMGDKATALEAYRNGIASHIDFVNERNSDDGQWPEPITAEEKADFLSNPDIVPTNPANLTLTQIMSQKYIALWGWGHNEIWMDLRRYHYTDRDPVTGGQIYPNFSPPKELFADNGGKLVYRLRPRYNSEYVWNRDGLDAIGGLADDYHTKPLWIIQP